MMGCCDIFAKWIRPLYVLFFFFFVNCFVLHDFRRWCISEYFFSRWIGSDSLRKTSIKRREMLRSSRLCPLVRPALRKSVIWVPQLKPPELLTPGFNTFGGFEFPFSTSRREPRCFSVLFFWLFFSLPPFLWLSLAVVLSAEMMPESATATWTNSSSRKDNTPLPIRHRTPRSHSTTQRVTIPLLSFAFAPFSLSPLCSSSSSALPVHLPHRPPAKRTGGCSVPGSSLGHQGHRHRIQVYTTDSFRTL